MLSIPAALPSDTLSEGLTILVAVSVFLLLGKQVRILVCEPKGLPAF